MLYGELKKIVLNIPAISIITIALLISLLFTYISINQYQNENMKVDKYYEDYMKDIRGKMDEEKIIYINKEKEFIDNTIAKEEDMWSKYNENSISADTYQQYLDDDYYAKEHSASIEQVYSQYKSIKKLKEDGVESHFIYDTYWNFYFDMRFATFIQIIVIIFLIVNYVSREHTSGMIRMTDTYYHGRNKLFHIKINAVLICGCLISISFAIVYWIFFKINYN